jgi:biotin carboxyl carrier protein
MEVRAPLSGTIVRVVVEAGASVQEDDEILVLEAMKMETPLFAPCSGTVTAINVKEGEKVQENQLLATIE